MRQLKNWTITAKSVKNGAEGLLNYVGYLSDTHRHTKQVLTTITDEDNLKNIMKKSSDFELDKKLLKRRHKGGRPSNFGWSTVLSYPFEISNDDFKKVLFEVATNFYTYVNSEENLNLKEDEILEQATKYIVAVIHQGEKINNHIHIIFGKHFIRRNKGIFSDKTTNVSIDLTKKKYLHRLKIFNDEAVSNILHIDKVSYKIKSKTKQSKRQSISHTKRQKLDIELAEVEQLKSEVKLLRLKYAELSEKAQISNDKALTLTNMKQDALQELQGYARSRFEKDLALHSSYIEKGMTQKADKLKAKIENRLDMK